MIKRTANGSQYITGNISELDIDQAGGYLKIIIKADRTVFRFTGQEYDIIRESDRVFRDKISGQYLVAGEHVYSTANPIDRPIDGISLRTLLITGIFIIALIIKLY